ncbi:hypothetical protein AMR74_00035 [Halorubrum tropicale]|uniref:Uncharacterized protein n=1 Tax=Halorubrum tropicale TaxID=1765655 RepID=A0A0N0BRU5_9EURY|nr:hypothetical protein AMR74_00035 [Halorubrum tropicale]
MSKLWATCDTIWCRLDHIELGHLFDCLIECRFQIRIDGLVSIGVAVVVCCDKSFKLLTAHRFIKQTHRLKNLPSALFSDNFEQFERTRRTC